MTLLACRIFVVAIACLELRPIGGLLYGVLTEGDSWGIGRMVAGLLAVPFVLLTIPALFLVFPQRRPGAAVCLAAASAIATIVAWRSM